MASRFSSTAPICKFFLSGSCKFGSRCRNRHESAADPRSTGGFKGAAAPPNGALAITRQSIVEDLLQENIYLFSSYGPDKSLYPPRNLVTGVDMSYEELRLMYYENRAAYISRLQPMIAEAMQKKKVAMDRANELAQELNVEIANAASTATSAFAQPSAASVFAKSPSAFAAAPSSGFAAPKSTFGQSAPSGSAFAMAPSSGAFGASSFGNVPTTFGNASQPRQNVFGNSPPVQNAFGAVPTAFGNTSAPAFGQAPVQANFAASQPPIQQTPTNVFGTTAFGQSQVPTPLATTNQQQQVPQLSNTANQPLPVPTAVDQAKWTTSAFSWGQIPIDEPPQQFR
eukprot:Partr_v1_DN28873_c0_g1_i1_m33155